MKGLFILSLMSMVLAITIAASIITTYRVYKTVDYIAGPVASESPLLPSVAISQNN